MISWVQAGVPSPHSVERRMAANSASVCGSVGWRIPWFLGSEDTGYYPPGIVQCLGDCPVSDTNFDILLVGWKRKFD